MKKKKKSVDKIIDEYFKEYVDERWQVVYLNGKASKYKISDKGNLYSGYVNRLMNPCPNSDGYPTTILTDGSKNYTISIHRLVATAFIPNPLNLSEVNHIDGNKLNNNVSNLEWCSHQENMIHANKSGLRSHIIGTENPNNKYPIEKIKQACELLSRFETMKNISSLTGIPITTIKNISRGKNWVSVSKYYDLPIWKHVNICMNDKIENIEIIDDVKLKKALADFYKNTSIKFKGQLSLLL